MPLLPQLYVYTTSAVPDLMPNMSTVLDRWSSEFVHGIFFGITQRNGKLSDSSTVFSFVIKAMLICKKLVKRPRRTALKLIFTSM